jgi:hypothetical protein
VSTAIAGDPARYIKALREETSYFDVQGLKLGDNRATFDGAVPLLPW